MKRHFIVICLQFISYSLTAQLYDSCLLFYQQADYERVKYVFEKDQQLQAQLYDSIDLLDAVSTAYINLGEFTKAKSLILTCFPTPFKLSTPPTLAQAIVLNNLGLVYDEQYDFDSALYCLNRALKMRSALLGKEDHIVAESYFNLGSLFSKMGDYDKAEDLLGKTLSIETKQYSSNDPSLALTLNNLGVVNEECGRLTKALNYYAQATSIFAINPGRKSYQYGLLLFNQAKVLVRLNQLDSANLYFANANQILNNANVPMLEFGMLQIEIIDRLISSNQLRTAEDLLQKTEEYWKSNSESYTLFEPELLLSKAALFQKKGQNSIALKLIDEAKTRLNLNPSRWNFSVSRMLDYEALLFFQEKRYDLHNQNFILIHHQLHRKIRQMFPSFSEKEREQFFLIARPYFEKYPTLLLTPTRLKGIAGQLYNNQLATKAILLNYTNRWKRQILMSGDVELIKQFTHWQELKSRVQVESERRFANHSLSLDSLEEEVNSLEKGLSARSEYFARHIDNTIVDWKAIRARLKKNEAAIEIIRFRKFDYSITLDFTEEVFYAALIVTHRTKEDPDVVIFKNGNELESRILKNYRNSILLKQEDLDSYNQFWEPIHAKLKGVQRVYFSPDGIFNLINFNTLKNSKTGKYLMEEIEWRQVTNTIDLLASSEEEEKNNNYALLFGGPDFQTKAIWQGDIKRSFIPSARTYQSIKMERGQSLSFLPGAKMEVENIRDLLESYQWSVDLFEGKNALEENLKHSLKPKLLHIATHGYFQADSKYSPNQRGAENLLLRSGLMLAGAETSYNQLEMISDLSDQEDGILTSYEAMNLNLENTELVVLSACETGLGEIQNGEGVYGLQRAFRVAGARSLIMSLWKVDDEVTRYLMELFYKEWLNTRDKYGALLHAQKIVKEKFPEPYYWGAFVIVGNL